MDRRKFLTSSGIAALPMLIPIAQAGAKGIYQNKDAPITPIIKLFGDGEMFLPGEYINELQKAHSASAIERDIYGAGGAVEKLEKRFAEITGKEKAIFLPTGTLANQLAIAILSGENTKVFVQDTSHVYRDEADAAQSVFGKRLIPLAKGETYFTAQQLKEAVETMPQEEAFKTGIGAISVENPVRRTDGRVVPIEEIRNISDYCRDKGIKLHLDGARIYLASTWSGVPVKEYATYFDTVYISLYKYLGAAGGAILCGDKTLIDKVPHLMKVHGGTMFGNWANAAMALHRLEGLEARLQNSKKRSTEIFTALNQIDGITVTALPGGTNLYNMVLGSQINGKKMQENLAKNYNIRMSLNKENKGQIAVNETLLYQSADYVINAFRKSV